MRLKTVIRNINILNILLLTVILIFTGYSIAPLLEAKITYPLPPAKKHLNVLEEKEDATPLSHLPSVLEYALIGDNNLFHPERKIPVEKKAEQPLPKPDFVLFGTLITDDLSMAYLEDLKAPFSTTGRGKRQIALKKGNTLSGFMLKEIESDKIVMARGDEKITVSINDPSHPRQRQAGVVTPIASTQPQEKPKGIDREERRVQEQRRQQSQGSVPPSAPRSRVSRPGTGN
jgi:hypothetical protein